MMSCDDVRRALGVYVLGAIDPAERSELDAHLATCGRCRDELASLAGLPALLARIPAEEFHAEAAGSDPGLLSRLLEEVRARRRRYYRSVLAAASAVVILLGGGLIGGFGGFAAFRSSDEGPGVSASPQPTPVASVSATDPRTNVWAEVGVEPRLWGTSLGLRLGGVPKGSTCRLVAVGTKGTRDVAASWTVNYRGEVAVAGATALYPQQISRFEIVTDGGQRLVSVPAGKDDRHSNPSYPY